MISNLLTARDIAEAIGITPRVVRLKANKEQWRKTYKKGKGGNITVYPVESLPEKIILALNESEYGSNKEPNSRKGSYAGKFTKSVMEHHGEIQQDSKLQSLKVLSQGPCAKLSKVEFAMQVITLFKQYLTLSREPKDKATKKFVELFNTKQLKLPKPLAESTKAISVRTLYRWVSKYEQNGVSGLLPQYGKRKGGGLIDSVPAMKNYCLALLHEYPHIKGVRIHELLEMEFSKQHRIPSVSTCRAWLANWKMENQELFMSLIDPSGWQNKRMVAFGSQSAAIENINQLWEFDSTPADVMLIDGRYSIIAVLDVFTRRVKVVLKPTSNAEGIALLIRNAILDWGLPKVVKTDNGSDYLSTHIATVWDSFGIKNIITTPYSGWEKPFIERFFRTFSHGMAELLQGYIGHDVPERERINARLTFANRLLEKKEKGAERIGLNVQLTAIDFEKFINQWLDHHYHHTTHSELKCTPFEQFIQHKQTIKRLDDERVLDVLLAPVPGQKGYRTITKEGISIEGSKYIHAELGAYMGERVFCRHDNHDIGRIYVFHALHGHFICAAENPEIVGNEITMQHAMEAKRIQRKQLSDQRKAFRKAARQHDVSDAAQKYLDYRSSQVGNITAIPKPAEQATTATIISAGKALKSKAEGFTEEQKSRFEKIRQEQIAQEKATKAINAGEPTFNSEHHKARYYCEQTDSGGTLTPMQKSWLHDYRKRCPKQWRMLDKIFNANKKENGL